MVRSLADRTFQLWYELDGWFRERMARARARPNLADFENSPAVSLVEEGASLEAEHRVLADRRSRAARTIANLANTFTTKLPAILNNLFLLQS